MRPRISISSAGQPADISRTPQGSVSSPSGSSYSPSSPVQALTASSDTSESFCLSPLGNSSSPLRPATSTPVQAGSSLTPPLSTRDLLSSSARPSLSASLPTANIQSSFSSASYFSSLLSTPSSQEQALTASSDSPTLELPPHGNPFSTLSPTTLDPEQDGPVSIFPSPSWNLSRSSSSDRSDSPASPTGGFPPTADRWALYASINPRTHWSLDDPLDLPTVQNSLPASPGSFFPTQPDLLEHSLGVANGLFSVRPSLAVPGEFGLFLDFSHPGYSHVTLLGCYTGWVHAFNDGDLGSPPFTSPVFDMYCLDIGNGLIVTAYDSSLSHEQRAFIFPYSFANEFIWHPEGNLLSFGDNGTVFFGAHGDLTIDSEVFMAFGPQHDWSSLRHVLMLRTLDTLHALAIGLGLNDWAEMLLPYRIFLQDTPLPDILASSSPSLHPLLLIHALVDWYQLHSLSGHVHSFPGDTLGAWITRCAKVRLFSIHHVFRKANHPARPPYDLDSLIPQLIAIPSPPDRSRLGRALRPTSSIRHRSFIHDPQDPHEDLLSDHFLSDTIPYWFSSPPEFGLPPTLDLPFPPLPLDPSPATPPPQLCSIPSNNSPPRVDTQSLLLSPFAPFPLLLSPTRPPRRSMRPGGLLVSLAISFERSSDRVRILQLLQHFAVVISVSHISPPADRRDYGELYPYVLSSRYLHVSQDFSILHQRNSLSQVLSTHAYLSPRVVVLDYFHLAAGYYSSRYGKSWFSHSRSGLSPLPGICQVLLQHVTDVFLPRDKGGDLDSFHAAYIRSPPQASASPSPRRTGTPSHAATFRSNSMNPPFTPSTKWDNTYPNPPSFEFPSVTLSPLLQNLLHRPRVFWCSSASRQPRPTLATA